MSAATVGPWGHYTPFLSELGSDDNHLGKIQYWALISYSFHYYKHFGSGQGVLY